MELKKKFTKLNRRIVMEFKKEEFMQELEDLCDKYELTNICFGSTLKSENDKFIGFMGLRSNGVSNIVDSHLNAARLYQGCERKIINTNG
jgi:hypothetical protein